MSRLGLLALLLGWLIPAAAPAEELVSTLSEDQIEITSSFVGSHIVVFGAVRQMEDGGEAGDYEIAVVVEGPRTSVVSRRRERVLGVWMNTEARQFFAVPSYYAVHVSEGVREDEAEDLLARFLLDLDSLLFVRTARLRGDGPFAEAVIDYMQRRALYEERHEAVTFLAPGVFRTTFYIPAIVPVGAYRASVYLFRNGRFVASRTEILSVVKTGFSDRLARFADGEPFLYGSLAMAIALMIGWLASVMFRRP